MKNSQFLLLFIFLALHSFQTQAQTWEKTIKAPDGDEIFDFTMTNDDQIALFINNRDFLASPSNGIITLVLLEKDGTIKKQKTLKAKHFDPNIDSAIADLHTINSINLNQ